MKDKPVNLSRGRHRRTSRNWPKISSTGHKTHYPWKKKKDKQNYIKIKNFDLSGDHKESERAMDRMGGVIHDT